MIQKGLLFSILILVFTSFSFLDHESYMSVTKMNYNSSTNTIQCEMKITAHDLEKALKVNSGRAVVLDKPSLEQSNNNIVKQYLQNKFSVKINDIKTYVDFVGFEVELNDNAWIYFEIPCPENINSVEVSNLILTETFALQQNVTHITHETNTHSFVFTKNETHNTFNWNE